ncbi:type II secretion system protein [Salmonella enterica]|uniref:Type II secretion system protein n=1 Tax=Salmonella enterica TaxID=28901 RepID=A0A5T2JPD0_SALER|nr:type II secretion system protein [Salmonella enterica]EDX6616473.1 type II secretion system protein [Salmonella enterica subsp. enterica serovar Thompson]EJV3859823.1 type II secretion system protein [Salmonella enterica subsp. enterica serovar Schwarzengrund]EKV4023517.1 type II secretion system protein [Enterobacter hormaechei]EKW8940769.1 type II secretion system protein [Klebsiella aerogenes]HAN9427425.1 type II secretion system protein [Escherichia coli]HBS3688494.1 type II secretion 
MRKGFNKGFSLIELLLVLAVYRRSGGYVLCLW